MGSPSTEILTSSENSRFLLYNLKTETYTEATSEAQRDAFLDTDPFLTNVTGVEIHEEKFREQNQKGS